MPRLKKAILRILFTGFLFLTAMMGFLWWNHYPPLPKKWSPPIYKVGIYEPPSSSKIIKICSYNIHFGIGLHWNRKDHLEKKDFMERLNKIASVLKEIEADIVLLQEVDFDSQRTQCINQPEYLAHLAGYPYIAIGPQLREKFHPSIHCQQGKINYGLAILSKFPLSQNTMEIFPHTAEMPFYLKGLYPPHGMQSALASTPEGDIFILNVHLEPWSQRTREAESNKIASITKKIQNPIVIGGDFNSLPPETPIKQGLYLSDTPWFIDQTKWDLEKETTIKSLKNLEGFTETIQTKIFLADEKATFTFPADNPQERLDYIFAGNKAKIIYGYVYHPAREASDHLPITGYVKLD